jgi:hypothetical protein
MKFLQKSLSSEIIAHGVGLESTVEVWVVITNMFSSQFWSNISHLSGALNKTKKNELVVAQFFSKMKGFCSKIATTGKVDREDEMEMYILNGLDGSYNTPVSPVNANPATIDDLLSSFVPMACAGDMLAETAQDTCSF